jgi:hypothetical protein
MKFFLPITSLAAIAMQISTLLDLHISRHNIFYFFLVLWIVTGAALSFMLLNSHFCRMAKQKKMFAQLEALIQASKGKFFSISFTLPNGEKKVINGKNFYRSLLSQKSKFSWFIDRNRESWVQLKKAKNIRFICGKLNTMVNH